MEAALPAGARLSPALGAALFGVFVVRLSGIYLAMLTLAAAQILYAVAFQWVEVTGGDNGIVGVWPSAGRRSRRLLLSDAGARRPSRSWSCDSVIDAPFGYALRAARDSERAPKPSASTSAGTAGSPSCWPAPRRGLAGGLYAFSRGLGRSERARHPDLGRCADHAAARRHADASWARSSGAARAACAARPDHAADLAVAAGARAAASSPWCCCFPRGLVGTRPAMARRTAHEPSGGQRSGKSFGGVVGGARCRASRSDGGEMWRSSARTAPASRRSSTWSAASSGRIAARSCSTGEPITRACAAGALPARASAAPSRSRRPSCR